MSYPELSSSEVNLDEVNRQASSRVYSTLDPNLIRTIKILPFGETSPELIECVLYETPLLDPTNYKALSYTWGSKADPGTIILNGDPYVVTSNLFMALKHLQAMGFDGAIWIDALCINQVDIHERNSQTRQMPQIYEKAELVLMWLGPEEHDSCLVLEQISVGSIENFSREWITGFYKTHSERYLNIFFNAIMALLLREYWHRLWIVQEIAYAREVLVFCGSMQVPYADLIKFLEALKLHDLKDDMIYTQTGRIIRLYLGACGPAGLKPPGSARSTDTFEDPTWMLARNATTKKCSDVRDRIYGCHGLFSPALRDQISVEYSRGPQETIKAATQAIIEITHRLDIILLKRRSDNALRLEKWEEALPSWAPELDDHFGRREIFFDALNPKIHSSVCGDRKANCRFTTNGCLLESTGILLGQINHLHERDYRPGDHMYGERREHVDLVNYIFSFRRYLGYKVHSRPELIAFWSTIFGNFMEMHKVFETNRDQSSGTRVYRATSNIADSIVNFAVEMQNINKVIEDRQGLLCWFRSLFSIPLLNEHQTAFLEPIYRHLDYRAFFCFQRATSPAENPDHIVDSEMYRAIDIGVGPTTARVGDSIVVLYGCKLPVILRPKGQRFQVIGDAYLSENMNGEIIVELEAGKRHAQIFCLE